MGGRIGYSAVTGIVVLLLCWFGIIAVLSAIIPVVAILPILLYIGMLIGSQAFQESPHRHAPAIVLALLPQIAEWGKTQIDNALGAAGHQRRRGGPGQARLRRRAVWRPGTPGRWRHPLAGILDR